MMTKIHHGSMEKLELRTYNAYRKNIGNSQLRKNLGSLQQQVCGERLRHLIDDSKQKFFLRLTKKFKHYSKSTKAYLAVLKKFSKQF